MMRESLIEVRGLCNRFGSNVVHDNLDLDLYPGEILGVVGGSGTGKSVLLRSIVGLIRPSAGEVRLFGQNLLRLDEAARAALEQRMGVLFQGGALFSSLSVRENVALPLIEHGGLSRADAEALAEVKLALAGLAPQTGDLYPASLSGGMVKRAALARALALDPDVLFLDEPTAGLDPIGAAAFDQLLLTLRNALGLTVFMVTHDLDSLWTLCDRIAVLSRKRVLVADTPQRVAAFDDPWVQDYFNGPRGRAALAGGAGEVTMETRAHHVLIGLFTLLSLLLALGFGVWLAQSGQQQETRRYRVVFAEAVTGLTVGSLVQYNGLRVGEVKQLQLDPEDPRRVLADIEVSAATPINQGTRARMAIANITGAANILLSTDNPQADPLPQVPDSPPLIWAEPSPIGALLGNGETLLSGVNELVERGTELLSAENIERIGRVIHNLERLSDTLVQSSTGVDETLGALTAAADEARQTMAALRVLLAEKGTPMLADGQQAMQALAHSSAQLEQLLVRNRGALDTGLQGMAQVAPVMQELQRSLATLNRILSRLEDDPAGYLTGQPPAQEFTP